MHTQSIIFLFALTKSKRSKRQPLDKLRSPKSSTLLKIQIWFFLLTNRPISILWNSAVSNRPKHEATGNKVHSLRGWFPGASMLRSVVFSWVLKNRNWLTCESHPSSWISKHFSVDLKHVWTNLKITVYKIRFFTVFLFKNCYLTNSSLYLIYTWSLLQVSHFSPLHYICLWFCLLYLTDKFCN